MLVAYEMISIGSIQSAAATAKTIVDRRDAHPLVL